MDQYFSKYTTYLLSEENFVSIKNYKLKQNIIFIDSIEFQDDDKMKDLNKILLSVNLIADSNASLIKLEKNQSVQISDLTSTTDYDILVFGLKPNNLCLQGFEDKYKVYQFMNFNILFADSISKCFENHHNKSLLWSAIRRWKKLN